MVGVTSFSPRGISEFPRKFYLTKTYAKVHQKWAIRRNNLVGNQLKSIKHRSDKNKERTATLLSREDYYSL